MGFVCLFIREVKTISLQKPRDFEIEPLNTMQELTLEQLNSEEQFGFEIKERLNLQTIKNNDSNIGKQKETAFGTEHPTLFHSCI